MNNARVQNIVKNLTNTMVKRSPEILTAIGIAGMITTAFLSAKCTPKAMKLVDLAEEEKGEPLTKFETIKAGWKAYVPPMVTGTMSTVCLIGASSVNFRRNAALATAYTISETALMEYKDKVVESIGEKKEESIRDSIVKDRMDRHPLGSSEVTITHRGDTLCFDAFSGRYFKSDIEKIRKSENELNRRMLQDGYIMLNDLYDEIGLNPIPIGDKVGWNADRGLLEIRFGSLLADDGTPCIVLNYKDPGATI